MENKRLIGAFVLYVTATAAADFRYDLPATNYVTRLTASDPATWRPVADRVSVPTGGVTLAEGSLFKTAMDRNAAYLLRSFSVNHMLVPFRLRAGITNPPDDRAQVKFWDTDLRGSSAGRFLMGAGNTLRWTENAELRARLDALINGIETCRSTNGYILAYPPDAPRSEEPNYGRAWFTHGLIEAAIAGNPKAYGLLRGHADWFNRWELLPKLIYWNNNSHQGHIASTRTYLSPIGKPEDLRVAEKYYVCDWWMDELAARHEEAVWRYPLQNPHSYLITSFEAYLDHYRATGDKRFLDAMLGAWELIHNEWEHVGGSMAICEAQWHATDGKRVLHGFSGNVGGYPPSSYFISSSNHTGETCGSVFWVKFNQRFHQLYPDQEKYVSEIEKSIYNVCLANQMTNGSIRYHALMQGKKEAPKTDNNTCCEGQGTRLLGSLPEYIYSLAADGLYVNLFEPSAFRCAVSGKPVGLTLESRFPFRPEVTLRLSLPAPTNLKLRVRVPSWACRDMPFAVNGQCVATGKPGTYATLDRTWRDGDAVCFALPMDFRVTRYAGRDVIPGHDRYALEYGPILLAAVGPLGKNSPVLIKHDPSRPNEWLKPDPDRPLHFAVDGDTQHGFWPYWQVEDQAFTTFPVVEP